MQADFKSISTWLEGFPEHPCYSTPRYMYVAVVIWSMIKHEPHTYSEWQTRCSNAFQLSYIVEPTPSFLSPVCLFVGELGRASVNSVWRHVSHHMPCEESKVTALKSFHVFCEVKLKLLFKDWFGVKDVQQMINKPTKKPYLFKRSEPLFFAFCGHFIKNYLFHLLNNKMALNLIGV